MRAGWVAVLLCTSLLMSCSDTVEEPLEEIDTARVVEMQAALTNAGTAAATFLSEQGTYAAMAEGSLRALGFTSDGAISFVSVTSAPDSYCIVLRHAQLAGDQAWHVASIGSAGPTPSDADTCS